MIRGIGPACAKWLVRTFGKAVFDTDTTRLREVEGIGSVRARRIAAGCAEQKVVREIMLLLPAHGMGTSPLAQIVMIYGAGAVATITDDSWRPGHAGSHLIRNLRSLGEPAPVSC